MAGFEAAPAGADNIMRLAPTPNHDPTLWLDDQAPRSADKLRALRQKVADCHAVMTPHEDRRALYAERAEHQRVLDRMLQAKGFGGFGLDADDARVIAQKKLVDRADANVKRAKKLDELRTGAWREAGHVLRGVEDWLQHGLPGGVVLVEFDDIRVEAILRKGGERITDGIERLQREIRTLRADLHRVRSMQYPKSETMPLAKQWVEQLAQSGTPDVSAVVEHLQGNVMLADEQIIARVHNVDSAPAAAAIFNRPNVVALLAWLCHDMLLAKIEKLIDEETDSKSTLSTVERQKREAQITADALALERQEASLIWAVSKEGSPIWFRSDADPCAILGLRLETSTRPLPSGTSPEHAGIVSYGQRR